MKVKLIIKNIKAVVCSGYSGDMGPLFRSIGVPTQGVSNSIINKKVIKFFIFIFFRLIIQRNSIILLMIIVLDEIFQIAKNLS